MNLPNKLTLSRLVLTAVFVVCFYIPWANTVSLALLVFGVASITDYYDGKIARARGIVTNFGKLFDPLADKILIAAAFILLASDTNIPEASRLPAWIAIVILSREFFVTGIRLVAAGQGAVLAAETLGKHKMLWQILTVIYFMMRQASGEPIFGFTHAAFTASPEVERMVAAGVMYFTTLLTLVSGFSYFWKNRHMFDDA
ncbi:CDP-diacylglycerol--glycerol-3-phosphate 3-phosphatidyltransferase [Prosthecobacter vanneervenii]|uniref:CDP-diacylglycerol--glycerol-3-phosphate 3-phosphatidyltransferase n=1 Tax=Prosthecobacter vanneervenii TaxID=48466 RepID=A0A7W7YG57_9BACT|nr:CDP-diacylglycerol--glycerol-3-phosphate 3-phosphatidyltransferase [Prosthecobacter vanneervenii]MBB5035591.1 CDP-diacylglycerol--glycerol-3-phosphate 3-phosphatidyltransferase [Prosthecobacter vanneervenii]